MFGLLRGCFGFLTNFISILSYILTREILVYVVFWVVLILWRQYENFTGYLLSDV